VFEFNERDDREIQGIGQNMIEMGVVLLGSMAVSELGELSPLPTIGMEMDKSTGLEM